MWHSNEILDPSKNYKFNIYNKYTDKLAAYIEIKNGVYRAVKVDLEKYPINLFGIDDDIVEETRKNIIEHFLEGRVVPKNRQFLQETLESVGMCEWDLIKLMKLNRGMSCVDYFYVEVIEDEQI